VSAPVTTTTRRGFLQVAALATGGLAVAFVLPGCHGVDPATAAQADKTGTFAPNAWIQITPDDQIRFLLDRVEMGQGTMTSHTTLVAEELDVEPARIHVEHAPVAPAYEGALGLQITGGSNSVASSWKPLRLAAATAREMLVGAAASAWEVPAAECAAENGAVVHRPSGRRQTFGQLCVRAAHQPVPANPRLKPPSEFRWIGKSVTRVDGRMKVDGTGIFGIDVTVPGLLGAHIFRVPTGVAVVAEKYWQAKAAAARVKVTWDEGPLSGLSSAWLWEQYEKRAQKPGKTVRSDGDFDAAMAHGTKRVEAVYRVPYLAHATMEPMNATAWVRDGRCDIWAGTQAPGVAQEAARRITELPLEAIFVHTTLLGGAFGRRADPDFVADAVHVSNRLKRPVKVVWSREDDMSNDHYRPMTYNVMRGAVDARGDVGAYYHHIVAQSIVSQVAPVYLPAVPGAVPLRSLAEALGRSAGQMYERNVLTDPMAVEGASDFAYKIPDLRVEYSTMAPDIPVGAWRSVGNSENVFIAESFLDELIHAAGKDPYQARRAMLAAAPRHLRVLDLAAQKAGWGTPLPAGVFRGIAQAKSFGSYCAEVAEVSVTGNQVRVHRVVAAIDCGTVVNPDLVRAQIESAIVFGLSAALKQEITFARGRVEQRNFNTFRVLRMNEMPKVEVHIVPSEEPPSGVGEPGLPPLAPAVTNAIFAATSRRVRTLPIEKALAVEAGS
jgi:CO/xanthine dehydrogenase Mo-binding subunit